MVLQKYKIILDLVFIIAWPFLQIINDDINGVHYTNFQITINPISYKPVIIWTYKLSMVSKQNSISQKQLVRILFW